jgi:hypothetical protein
VYLNAAAYLPYFLAGKALGVFSSPADITAPVMLTLGVGKTAMPSTVLMGRLLTVAFSAVAVILSFAVAKSAYRDNRVGLIAALLVSGLRPAG